MLPWAGGITVGGLMALDSDIGSAVSALDLDRLRTQEYRRDVTFQMSDASLRMRIVEALAVNYMKPTTATLAESIAADVTGDVARLRAAVNAVLGLVKNG